MPLPDEKPLEGWKEIAKYLGRSERTVQRWEQKGLPVHRHEALGVIAYPSEMNVWLQLRSNDEQVAEPNTPIEHGPELAQQSDASARGADVDTDLAANNLAEAAVPARGRSFDRWLKRWVLPDSWIARAAALRDRITGLAWRSSVWRYLLAGVMAAVFAVLVIAVLAPAYGLAIGAFALGAGLLTLIYLGSERTPMARALVSTYMIAGMSYIASASTMPDFQATIINVTTLSPAEAFLFVIGLKFIPLFILNFLFWVILGWRGDTGFSMRPGLRNIYILLGILFLVTELIALAIASGDDRVLAAGVPGRWVLIVGSAIIFLVNLIVWFAGLRCFSGDVIPSYSSLFSVCAIAYLSVAIAAFFIDNEHNLINRYYLNVRWPEAYVATHPEAIKEMGAFLQGNLKGECGPDLISVLNDPDFREALRTGTFYKQHSDEAFQVFHRAVMFGYQRKTSSSHSRSRFVVIRFPKELADALRFESIDEKN